MVFSGRVAENKIIVYTIGNRRIIVICAPPGKLSGVASLAFYLKINQLRCLLLHNIRDT